MLKEIFWKKKKKIIQTQKIKWKNSQLLLQEAIFQILEYYTPKKIKKLEKKGKCTKFIKYIQMLDSKVLINNEDFNPIVVLLDSNSLI